MQVILQSGGVGSRLYPFTINKPKCFLKLKDKPIIDYQYENLKKYNLHKKLIIISNKNHVHHFQRYFKNKKGHIKKEMASYLQKYKSYEKRF